MWPHENNKFPPKFQDFSLTNLSGLGPLNYQNCTAYKLTFAFFQHKIFIRWVNRCSLSPLKIP